MATFLAGRMQAGGHTCLGIWGRNSAAAAELARTYNYPLLQSLAEVHDGPDACLLAVSDSAIKELAARFSFYSTVIIHHSGSAATGTLGTSRRQGIVWPVCSILKRDLPAHRNFPCIYEANTDGARRVVQEVCAAISSIQYEAGAGQRRWLHLAAVIGNNFTNYLLGMCADICAAQNMPFSLLQPILQQTLDRTNTIHPYEVQTGPARRGDEVTIAAQMELLHENPYWQTVYYALSDAIKNTYSTPTASD
jgi:predicted short-subunit dehydrogenase-like oxidoreductase (DUF2520 family)